VAGIATDIPSILSAPDSRTSPNVINVLVAHDREQPSSKIGARLPEFFLDKCAAERVLHQIICPLAIAREHPRIASQSRDLLFDESMKSGQFVFSLRARPRYLLKEIIGIM
jgi:hypothetical protein